MLYSERHRTAFLHIHKTAGLSVRRVLRTELADMEDLPELPDPHYSITQLFDVLEQRGVDPATTEVVATICHPMAHAVSIYEFWRSDKLPPDVQALAHVARTRELDFDGFLGEVLRVDEFALYLHVDGVLPPNVTLLRREHLARDTARFLSRILERSVTVHLPHVNRTPHAPPADYFDEAAKERLVDIYSWTFGSGIYDPDVVPADDGPRGIRRWLGGDTVFTAKRGSVEPTWRGAAPPGPT